MSSDGDVKALTRKIDAMWALGVRVFQLQFQDVSYSEWHCDDDADTFGSRPGGGGAGRRRGSRARSPGTSRQRHPGAEPLSVMPTEFYQDGATDYRTALAEELDDRVQIAWTGVGVVPRTITGRELAGARATFRHPLVTMDNYPVNDYAQDRIFLGPYTGRDPAVAIGSAALLANAMEQPSASRIPLFTAADFAWNPRVTCRRSPGRRRSTIWRATTRGPGRRCARWPGTSASSVLGGDESAYLQPLLAAFWKSRTTANATAQADAAARAAGRLHGDARGTAAAEGPGGRAARRRSTAVDRAVGPVRPGGRARRRSAAGPGARRRRGRLEGVAGAGAAARRPPGRAARRSARVSSTRSWTGCARRPTRGPARTGTPAR